MRGFAKYLILQAVTFCVSGFTTDGSCVRELASAWNLSAGWVTLAYDAGALFRLEGHPGRWQIQQTKFPFPVRHLRPLQLSKRSFQSSAFVAAIEVKDARVVWIGSLLFPETSRICFPEEVLDAAWLETGPKSYRLLALTGAGVYSIEVFNRSEKPCPGSQIEKLFGFQVETRTWDRLFAESRDRIWLVRETGQWGRVDSNGIHETKPVEWVYSVRTFTENGATGFCGTFSQSGQRVELCFSWDPILGWQFVEVSAALRRPAPIPGFLDLPESISPSMQLLLKNASP